MQGQVQQFASAPQAVGTRKKYRDTLGNDTGKNLMHDKRVVRGATCQPIAAPSLQDTAEVQKQREAHRRRLMRASQTRRRADTPEPVPGRKHLEIQTDRYLEVLTERTVEFEAATQTDYLLDRPSSPLFMPTKIGVDMETQIEEGELFDFDVECEPLLEVLVGKTLEQSMMEVLEEEELESLRRHQEDFEKRRNAELLEVQRMEDAEQRRSSEMERRIKQQVELREKNFVIMKKVVSRSVAAAHLTSLMDRTMAHMADAGIFSDSLDVAVDADFVPNLLEDVMKQMSRGVRDRQLAAEAMQVAVSQRLAISRQRIDAEKERLKAIDEAVQKARDEEDARRAAEAQERQRLEDEARAKAERQAELAQLPKTRNVEIAEIVELEDASGTLVKRAALAPLSDGLQCSIAPEEVEQLEKLLQDRKAAEEAGGDLEAFRIAGLMEPDPEGSDISILSKIRVLEVGEELNPPPPSVHDDNEARPDGLDGDGSADDDNEARPDGTD